MIAPTIDQIRSAWDGLATGYDRYVTPEDMPFGEAALERVELGPGVRFLDVAAGSGALAIPAARRGADVVAVDLAPTMIEHLRTRADVSDVTLQALVMNGEHLEFEDDSFDVTASQNGVSLFPDLAAGLCEMVRVTRPGGRVLVVAFGPAQTVEFLGFFIGALQAVVPGLTPPPMDPPPLPMRLGDPVVFEASLTSAGLSDVVIEQVTWHMPFSSAAHFWDVVTSSNPLAVQITAGLTPSQIADTRELLDGMLRERSGGTPGAVLTAAMNIGIGTA
jgi:SAM-dependent methyltransferase